MAHFITALAQMFSSTHGSPQAATRQKLLLVAAVPFVLLLVLLLASRELTDQRQQANEQLNANLNRIAWLQEHRHHIPRVSRLCLNSSPKSSWHAKRLTASAGRYNIEFSAKPQIANNQVRFNIGQGQGNKVLEWLALLACQGASFQTFELNTLNVDGSANGKVSGQLLVNIPAT